MAGDYYPVHEVLEVRDFIPIQKYPEEKKWIGKEEHTLA